MLKKTSITIIIITLFLYLISFNSYSQLYSINIDSQNFIIEDGNVYIEISPVKAFGSNKCESLTELENKFDERLLRDKLIIEKKELKRTTHYNHYLTYVPYMILCYDYYDEENKQILFIDMCEYYDELSTIKNYTTSKSDY